ncbi:MAG: GlcG/HbpS family heme-binding protein [Rhodomicrobium sp.]
MGFAAYEQCFPPSVFRSKRLQSAGVIAPFANGQTLSRNSIGFRPLGSVAGLPVMEGVKHMVTLEKAHRVIAAGEAKANEIGQPMNIAVVDAGTNLKAFIRMDGAWLGSIDIAINKAFTAKAFDISTKELGQNSQPGDQFFGINVSNHNRVMIFAGGIPLKVGGKIVGAVGVSGGSGEQDQAVAEAAAAVCS